MFFKKTYIGHHIFPKSQVTSNKNAHNLQHYFGAQVFMLYHMVGFILFGVLGQETTLSLVKILQHPIRNFHFNVFRANARNKMGHTMWNSMKTGPKNDVRVCVHFCLRPLAPLERCVLDLFLRISNFIPIHAKQIFSEHLNWCLAFCNFFNYGTMKNTVHLVVCWQNTMLDCDEICFVHLDFKKPPSISFCTFECFYLRTDICDA